MSVVNSSSVSPLKPRVLSSLWQGLRALLFLRPDPRRIGGDVVTLCLLFLFDTVLTILVEWTVTAFQGRFNWNAVAGLFVQIPFLLLAGWVAGRRSLKGIDALDFPALAVAIGPPLTVLSFAVLWLGAAMPLLLAWFYPVFVLWWAAVLMVAYVRLIGRGWRRSGVGHLWIFIAASAFVLPHPSLFLPAVDEDAQAPYQPSIEREDAIYAQQELLDNSLARLKPQRAGVEDLYFVGFAGYAPEDVFYKELGVIEPLMRERFDAEGRSVLLVNNPQTVLQLPIASNTNLRRALRAIGQKINRDEDVVVLYLTSHGSADHTFSVQFGPLALDNLTPALLKTMLDEAGIKWRVIVVSACYSGGYIGPLKDEQTLVMTAADATHTSFGCGAESDFTYFGRALFDEELRKTHSFADAFEKAKVSIRSRELAQGYQPSNPQIALGSLMAYKLARITARLAGPTAGKPETPAQASAAPAQSPAVQP
jgi:hypothetical protein